MNVEGKQLTEEMIVAKSKTDNFQEIKNLNLWNCDLEGLRILSKLPRLEVLSLSVNKIRSLADFANCLSLQ
jgi:hypothetical protein